ncbi:MAG: sulfotransferase family 2 domain-containing protein [Proteobacteria bacterium]|nr:sulfotransferase family 2 domain-containing protein [Pseudomonadota bacterium]
MLWRMMPESERQMLLSYAPQYQRRHIDRILKGRAGYQSCFDTHRALFIHIPKSAGRSVVRGLFDVKSVEHAPADWYQQLDPDKFDNYFKFTFVRNPWDRAVSAYTYLRKGGSPASNEDQHWAKFVNSFKSFDDFVCRWMSDENINRNALFTPQRTFLKDIFGQVTMDYIGRFESLEQDFNSIAEKLGISAQLPHLNQSRVESYQSFYSAESQAIIERLYADDIAEFSYVFN